MLVTFGICLKQHFDTRYLVFCNISPPRMFLPLDLLSEYRIQHGAIGPLFVTSSHSTWKFCRRVSGFATDCPCGVWWRGALMYSLICAWTNVWANHRDTGDLRRRRFHYDVTVMRSQYHNITRLGLLNAFRPWTFKLHRDLLLICFAHRWEWHRQPGQPWYMGPSTISNCICLGDM